MSNILKFFLTIILMAAFATTMYFAAAPSSVAFALYLVASAVIICIIPSKNKKIEAEHVKAK